MHVGGVGDWRWRWRWLDCQHPTHLTINCTLEISQWKTHCPTSPTTPPTPRPPGASRPEARRRTRRRTEEADPRGRPRDRPRAHPLLVARSSPRRSRHLRPRSKQARWRSKRIWPPASQSSRPVSSSPTRPAPRFITRRRGRSPPPISSSRRERTSSRISYARLRRLRRSKSTSKSKFPPRSRKLWPPLRRRRRASSPRSRRRVTLLRNSKPNELPGMRPLPRTRSWMSSPISSPLTESR